MSELSISTILTLIMILVPVQYYYLGDGYALLAKMVNNGYRVYTHNWLGMELPYRTFRLLDGGNEATAVLAYRLVAWGSGLLFILVAIAGARRLFSSAAERILFVLMLLSGGYTLQFFGYVENYAFLLVAVLCFTLIGLLVVRKQLNVWWLLPSFGLAAITHIFGLLLLPGAVAAVVLSSEVNPLWQRLSKSVRWVLVLIPLFAGLAALGWLYATSLRFQLSLMPFMADYLTVEGYTLLSPKHLLDLMNLIFLLIPGVLILALGAGKGFITSPRVPENIYLLVLAACAWLGLSLINPKLGMPRDWDLFAFAGIPLAIALFVGAKETLPRVPFTLCIVLAICAGFGQLTARVVAVSNRPVMLAHLDDYCRLDVKKNSPIRYLLIEQFYARGDTTAALRQRRSFHADFPEFDSLLSAQKMASSGQFQGAARTLKKCAVLNPMSASIWTSLGAVYVSLDQYDSALAVLDIANAMDPGDAKTLNNLGICWFFKENMRKAADFWLQSYERNPGNHWPLVGMYRIAAKREDSLEEYKWLARLAAHPKVPPEYLALYATYLKEHSLADSAAVVLRRLDSATVR